MGVLAVLSILPIIDVKYQMVYQVSFCLVDRRYQSVHYCIWLEMERINFKKNKSVNLGWKPLLWRLKGIIYDRPKGIIYDMLITYIMLIIYDRLIDGQMKK